MQTSQSHGRMGRRPIIFVIVVDFEVGKWPIWWSHDILYHRVNLPKHDKTLWQCLLVTLGNMMTIIFTPRRGWIWGWSSSRQDEGEYEDDHLHTKMRVNMRMNAKIEEAWRLVAPAIWLARGNSDLKLYNIWYVMMMAMMVILIDWWLINADYCNCNEIIVIIVLVMVIVMVMIMVMVIIIMIIVIVMIIVQW